MGSFHYSPPIHQQLGRRRSEGADRAVSTFTVDPGARVLWCLRRRASDVRCVVYVAPAAAEVQILQERDLVLKELFPSEAAAVSWADEYRGRLKQQGWHDSPEERSPWSAA